MSPLRRQSLTVAQAYQQGFKGDYKPFAFNQAIMTTDIEFSEEMFLITKETAEAYLNTKAAPAAPAAPEPEAKPGEPVQPLPPAKPEPEGRGAPERNRPEQLTFTNVSWTGDIPPQKWMKFYTAVLSKFAAGRGLKLKLTVGLAPEGGLSKQKLEETKAALRDLGLNDDLTSS